MPWKEANGVSIHYKLAGERGPVVVLLHELGGTLDSWDGVAPGLSEQVSPNWHFLHIDNDVVPALRERGVSEDQIGQMLRDTPRDFFER